MPLLPWPCPSNDSGDIHRYVQSIYAAECSSSIISSAHVRGYPQRWLCRNQIAWSMTTNSESDCYRGRTHFNPVVNADGRYELVQWMVLSRDCPTQSSRCKVTLRNLHPSVPVILRAPTSLCNTDEQLRRTFSNETAGCFGYNLGYWCSVHICVGRLQCLHRPPPRCSGNEVRKQNSFRPENAFLTLRKTPLGSIHSIQDHYDHPRRCDFIAIPQKS